MFFILDDDNCGDGDDDDHDNDDNDNNNDNVLHVLVRIFCIHCNHHSFNHLDQIIRAMRLIIYV